jgi:predicted MFS family arabinose efflux permease
LNIATITIGVNSGEVRFEKWNVSAFVSFRFIVLCFIVLCFIVLCCVLLCLPVHANVSGYAKASYQVFKPRLPKENASLFSVLSLWLSRACLGKTIVFTYKMAQKTRSPHLPSAELHAA